MDSNRIVGATTSQLRTWYRQGRTTPTQALEAVVERLEDVDSRCHAVAALDLDAARAAAGRSTARWKAGAPISPLDGIAVSVKDSFPVKGLKRWHGSKLNQGQPPSRHDGAPVVRLRQAGAVVFAKTTMPDLGLIAAGLSSQFGIVRNPWDLDLNPGGSSSGAAVLVACGLGPVSLGTDMGGSVRIPAALCGLVGLKPTQGLIAYDPPKLVGSPGPLARRVSDAVDLLEVVGAGDPSDHLSLPGRFRSNRRLAQDLRGTRVGVVTAGGAGIDVDDRIAGAVEDQARALERRGAKLVASPPVMSQAEAAAVHRVLLMRGLPELLASPPELWRHLPQALMDGFNSVRDASAVEYLAAEREMESVRVKVSAAIRATDLLLSPVLPAVCFPAEDLAPTGGSHLTFTLPFNITSMPAATIPGAVTAAGLPVGVQIGADRFADDKILSVLALLERERSLELDYPSIPTRQAVAA
ncbi:MAG: hypothetical protein LBD90_09805 [Bifidobacteriaceae bacterium]|jgi:Asp-tRNA(Asn)/Glu-tRNA(Gln) amidotransferase A subunit family amidase|nr:hypothetical protein [Bifidobacteriaceae bacterium]